MDPQLIPRTIPEDSIYYPRNNSLLTGTSNYSNLNKYVHYQGSQFASYTKLQLNDSGFGSKTTFVSDEKMKISESHTPFIIGQNTGYPNQIIDEYTRIPVALQMVLGVCPLKSNKTNCIMKGIAEDYFYNSTIKDTINVTNYYQFPAVYSLQCIAHSILNI